MNKISILSVILVSIMMLSIAGKTIVRAEENEMDATVEFDMSKRSTLYHGSTGFLYGAAELNVPTIDLMYNEYKEFLEFCKENDCMPEIITWHELQNDFRNFPDNYDKAAELVDAYYTEGFKPEICINEYGRHCDLAAAGDLVKWLAEQWK